MTRPLYRPKIGNPAPAPCAKTAPKRDPAPGPAPALTPAPRPRTSAPTTQSSAKWQSRLMTSSRSRTRAKPGRCPARRPQSRRPAIQEGRPCSFSKKETLHQPLVQGQNGVSAPTVESCHSTELSWDSAVEWPLSYQGPCFQAAVTYGLPCPAVRDSRAWERRRIY